MKWFWFWLWLKYINYRIIIYNTNVSENKVLNTKFIINNNINLNNKCEWIRKL